MSEALGKDTDAGILDAPTVEYTTVQKPIRMTERRSFTPINVVPGDSIQFTFTQYVEEKFLGLFGKPKRRDVRKEVMEAAEFKRAMSIDTWVRIEVIDEFGLDVGVGCLVGESKK